ncbi:hypothetical protein [Oceanirhabdus sp. W0125-5]|uniref:hypothetical protein n=1 Tax=Oceanirhabdus sp. W0125-5 TaxID=2999116 RepID=UPI0022F2DB1F|nr:hypothetical protein [Oceanirhabdus sp. W0125-5]WBW94942.1 hypothetical protein OW730_14690 [Oceanirhabdus sp. W0125-5]
MNCESCKINEIEVIEKNDDEQQPYLLCKECHKKLVTLSLRPLEWYNLAVIHSPHESYLYDDFYDDGIACAAEEDVIEAEKYPCPTLIDVCNDMNDLLDYCMTKYFVYEEELRHFAMFDKEDLNNEIKNRFENTNNMLIKSRLIEICGKCLGRVCQEWIIKLWENIDMELLVSISNATAYALPENEGIQLVLDALDKISYKELPHIAYVCLYKFNSSEVLKWIEKKVKSPVKDQLGRLAAVSKPDWDIISRWIDMGRPYSLVALDTLYNIMPPAYKSEVHEELNPKLLNPISVELMTAKLKEYESIDSVPRVKRIVKSIIINWNKII